MTRRADWQIPPKGAIPLWRLMFAHPEIIAAAAKALEKHGTVTVHPDAIVVAEFDWMIQFDEEGATRWETRVDHDEYGREQVRLHEEYISTIRPWAGEADEIIKTAWSHALVRFVWMLVDGRFRLEGRHPSALSPGRPIPLDALQPAAHDYTAIQWWKDCKPDYAQGSLSLLSGDRVWAVHAVPTQTAARAPRASAGEKALKSAIRRAVAESPHRKTTTRDKAKEKAIEMGLSENAGERAYNEVIAEISDPKSKAIWLKRGPVVGGIEPLILPPNSIP